MDPNTVRNAPHAPHAPQAFPRADHPNYDYKDYKDWGRYVDFLKYSSRARSIRVKIQKCKRDIELAEKEARILDLEADNRRLRCELDGVRVVGARAAGTTTTTTAEVFQSLPFITIREPDQDVTAVEAKVLASGSGLRKPSSIDGSSGEESDSSHEGNSCSSVTAPSTAPSPSLPPPTAKARLLLLSFIPTPYTHPDLRADPQLWAYFPRGLILPIICGEGLSSIRETCIKAICKELSKNNILSVSGFRQDHGEVEFYNPRDHRLVDDGAWRDFGWRLGGLDVAFRRAV